MRTLVAATALAVLTFAPVLQAQKVSVERDANRKAATVSIGTEDRGTLAAVSVAYTPASWQPSYDEMLERLPGANYMRFGKGWWATLDTMGPLELGGVQVEAGSYYFGLAVGKGGDFALLLFDSKQAMQAGLLPFTTALYRGEGKPRYTVPMTFAKGSLPNTVVDQEVEIGVDPKDPTIGTLSLRWGKHQLSAPMRLRLAAPAAAPTAAPKSNDAPGK